MIADKPFNIFLVQWLIKILLGLKIMLGQGLPLRPNYSVGKLSLCVERLDLIEDQFVNKFNL